MIQIDLSSCLWPQWTLKWIVLVCLVLMKVKMGYPCAWVKFLCQLYRASLLLICGSYRCRINILKRDPFHGKETWDTSTCIKSQSQGQLNNFGGLRQKFLVGPFLYLNINQIIYIEFFLFKIYFSCFLRCKIAN